MDGAPLAAGRADYERDVYAWAMEQAALLRAGRLSEADVENIAEEIESLGKSEKRELMSRLSVLLLHLLKWQVQPGLRTRSWTLTIREQRRMLARHLSENPSLRSSMDEVLEDAFGDAVIAAERETDLSVDAFPATCPWARDEILSESFLPP